jgi:signal peptidase II
VAGGAAGNLIDRVRSAQGVVDFIDVGVGATRWPTFNVADMGVSCGAIALAISLWMEDARRSRAEAAAQSVSRDPA